MKKVFIGVGVVVVLLVAGGIYLYSNLGGIIKSAIETYGSEATKAEVTLNSVDLDAGSGKAALNALSVGNPSGFKTKRAFELGSVAVQLDTSTLNSDPIVINSVMIDGPKITYELANGGSNVDAIKRNVDEYAKQFGGGGSSASSSEGEGPKIIIEKLTITGGEVKVSASFLDGKEMGSSLPTLTLTDIGKDDGGASPAEVIKQVIDKMTAGVGNAVSGLNLDDLAKGVGEGAKKLMEGAGEGASGAMEGASGAMDDAGKKLKGLLGN
ncbi:MAG: hypothetical protein JJ900_04350 [Rhodospirillales bacterium]|nr:hypothetical protein [Rhodospirillales bacterium]MBO6786060.1 hypothetical protein [Rhodospirillales bacterium]